GAYRFASWTLSGSAINGEVNADYDRYRFGAKYFVVDNFAVGGGYALTDYSGTEWDTWDIGGEFRFGSVPITLSAGYLMQEGDFVDVDAWQIGARWSFGTSDLREEDRTAPIAAIDAYLGDLRRWD
ncbi:MAG: porin, partial [Vitreimonas sp.]